MPEKQTSTYTIYTDATADLNDELLTGLPLVEIIPMGIEFGDESLYLWPGRQYLRRTVLRQAARRRIRQHIADQSDAVRGLL